MQHPEVEDVAWIYNGQQRPPRTVRRVKIAENIMKIPDEAFQNHQGLEEVILSSSVQVIGKEAFSHCYKLKSILCQGLEKEEVGIPSSVKVIDRSAFIGCKLLKSLVLNEGLEEIGRKAFTHCESLTKVEIPSTVEDIGIMAFHNCRLLARLGLNEGLRQIRNYAFIGCHALTKVDFPSTVQVVDHSAFHKCTSLTRLGLNEGLKRIGKYAFSHCYSLSHVRIPQSVNIIATKAFTNCSHLISIEIPEERSFNIDLSGCLSLVSGVGPISSFYHEVDEFGEETDERQHFFQNSKLGSLVVDEETLLVDDETLHRKLENRFDNSPLNKLCYFQSYHSWEDVVAQRLMEADPLAASLQVDKLGMTPLHILSLSQVPNLDMLLAVLDAGKPGHMVRMKDSFGCSPMDYLSLNRMQNLNEVIRELLQTRFGQVLGIDQFWKQDMLQPIDAALSVDWSSRKREIDAVVRQYERKEILSLLELGLWKVRIDEATEDQMLFVDRESFRFNSGASVVIPLVLPFLDKLDV